jgi:ADP-ribosylglycohydrolase
MQSSKGWWLTVIILLVSWFVVSKPESLVRIPADIYFDKVHGAWQATMVANHTGLVHEGEYLDEASSAKSIELVSLDAWPTDDDTSVEWVDLHILETYGTEPSYSQIRDEWVAHLNNDIWVATLRARQLMDQGVLPPDTGSADHNPEGVWSIDAQLQTELFGMLAPGLPDEASRRAVYFARVTNSGLAVEVSAFYATMYALAFFESDVPTLIRSAQTHFDPASQINEIVNDVVEWQRLYPDTWRESRRRIRDAYDTDPMWWASRVNFASTIMALLYGNGDIIETMTIASLAGWDADNNATTSAGLLGLIHGYTALPDRIRLASDLYFNEDVTGDMPRYQTITEIATRTQSVAETVLREAGGWIQGSVYYIPKR